MNNITTEIENKIVNMIFTFRRENVMIDRDLAKLFSIETKKLNQQVKRNIKRFENYIFQLDDKEKNELVTNCDRFESLKHSTSNPYAFNEHGILMLSSILNSDFAIAINRKIIKVFIEIRKQISLMPNYAVLLEKVKRIEAEQELIKTTQLIDNKLISDKVMELSKETHKMSEILDEFQNTHLIIKRPNDT